jgi:hypothetical protein
MLGHYLSLAPRPQDRLPAYLGLACLKLAVIMETIH